MISDGTGLIVVPDFVRMMRQYKGQEGDESGMVRSESVVRHEGLFSQNKSL